jgi:prepilin-type N-terminal cleavage/methylation domain-containing protein
MRCHPGRLGRLRTGRRGITLIELMVTVVLLAIGLVGVSSMFIVGYRTQLHAHFTSVASDMADKKMERMKSAGFNGIDVTNFPPTFTVAELPAGQGTIALAPYPDSTSTNQCLVTVTVTWGGGNGIAGRTVLATVISNHG